MFLFEIFLALVYRFPILKVYLFYIAALSSACGVVKESPALIVLLYSAMVEREIITV